MVILTIWVKIFLSYQQLWSNFCTFQIGSTGELFPTGLSIDTADDMLSSDTKRFPEVAIISHAHIYNIHWQYMYVYTNRRIGARPVLIGLNFDRRIGCSSKRPDALGLLCVYITYCHKFCKRSDLNFIIQKIPSFKGVFCWTSKPGSN